MSSVTQASARLGDFEDPRRCPQCERPALVARHCKTICPACGYVESCEDNFLPLRAHPEPPSDPRAS